MASGIRERKMKERPTLNRALKLWEEAAQIMITRGEIMMIDRGATAQEIDDWRDEYLVDLAADKERMISAYADFFSDPERAIATKH